MTTPAELEEIEQTPEPPSPGFNILRKRLPMALLAGALLALSFPPYYLPILLPFGIAILLRSLEGTTPRQAAYLGLVCGTVYFGATLFWLLNLFQAAAVPLIEIATLFIVLFSVLYSWLRRRFPLFPDWLLAAIVWTGVEYYRSELFTLNFGWVGLGYGVVNSPLFAAGASVVGSYGLTFWIIALGGMLARKTGSNRIAKLSLIALCALWIAGLYAPMPPPLPDNPVNVRLVQADSEDEDSLFALSKPAERFPVDIIVWPEYSIHRDPTTQPQLWKKLVSVAKENNSHLVFGAQDLFGPRNSDIYHNTAFVLNPAGELIGRHFKNHTVHLFNDGVRGTEANPINSSLGKLGVAICFDMDYPDVARRLTEKGAELLIVPNMDPKVWGRVQQAQHRLMFQMRAAECGRWLARADVAGGTSVSSPTGQEVARVNTDKPVKLEAQVGREVFKTLYIRGGWRFGQACLAALLTLCGLAVFKRWDKAVT